MQGWLYLSAYQKAIERNKLRFKNEYVYFGEISEKTGFDAMEHFFSLSTPPECIIFINDIPVIGAYHYLNVNKLEPEKNIHIMAGIISSDVSSYLLPKPIGFSIQHSQIGQALSHAVLNSLGSQNREFINTLIIPQP
jgi:LacI family transcriptional regulator